MNLNLDNESFTLVTLSRRNLDGLLRQLDDNAGTSESAQIMRTTKDGRVLIVVAEEDAAHYGTRSDGRAGASGPDQVYGERVA